MGQLITGWILTVFLDLNTVYVKKNMNQGLLSIEILAHSAPER